MRIDGKRFQNSKSRVMNILFKLKNIGLNKRKFFALLLLTFFLVVVLEIWSSNRLASYGEQLAVLQKDILNLKLQNQMLSNEVAVKSSLSQIDDVSGKLGFNKIKSIEYLKIDNLSLR